MVTAAAHRARRHAGARTRRARPLRHAVATYPAYRGIELPATAPVLGAQQCAWEQPGERELPSLRRRLAALAERTWNATTTRSGHDFLQRLAFTDARLSLVLGR